VVGLMLHLLVTYGVTNKPFSLVSKAASSNWLQDAVNDFGHRLVHISYMYYSLIPTLPSSCPCSCMVL